MEQNIFGNATSWPFLNVFSRPGLENGKNSDSWLAPRQIWASGSSSRGRQTEEEPTHAADSMITIILDGRGSSTAKAVDFTSLHPHFSGVFIFREFFDLSLFVRSMFCASQSHRTNTHKEAPSSAKASPFSAEDETSIALVRRNDRSLFYRAQSNHPERVVAFSISPCLSLSLSPSL